MTIILDEPRTLRFTMRAVVEYEQITGKMLLDSYADESEETIAFLLFVMLERELKIEDAFRYARDNKEYVYSKVLEAIHAAFKMKPSEDTKERKKDFFTFENELEIALEMGIKTAEFWNMTYSEFAQAFEIYQKLERRKINELLYLAWHIATFVNTRNLPDLKSILIDENKPAKKHEQTADQMMAMAKMLNAALGGKFVETN